MTRSRGQKVVQLLFSILSEKKFASIAHHHHRVPFFFCFFFFLKESHSPLSSCSIFPSSFPLSVSLAFCQTKRVVCFFHTTEHNNKTHTRLKTLSKHTTRAGFTRAVEWHWPFLEEQQQREQYSRRRFPPRWKEEEEDHYEFYQQQGKR